VKKALAHRYYRLGLAAAKQRDLSAALRYAQCAFIMDPENNDASLLAEICRHELGGSPGEEQIPEQAVALIKQKSWAKAARVLEKVPHQSVRCFAIQGCLWALAGRRALAADCFQRVLLADCMNHLAAEALVELRLKRNFFWRFF
jgi:tetratricopeptide (TPR) repeat protein